MERVQISKANGLSIAAVAEQTGLTVHTLRYYERVGLLVPLRSGARRDRRYRVEDLEWIGFMQRLRATGMPVREMVQFAELRRGGWQTMPARRELLDQHRVRLLDRIAALQAGLEAIEAKRSLLSSRRDSKE